MLLKAFKNTIRCLLYHTSHYIEIHSHSCSLWLRVLCEN